MNKLTLNQLIDPCLFCHPLLDICVFFLPFLPKKENLYKTEVFNPTSQLMTQKTTHPWRFQSSARWMLGSAAFADAPGDVRIPTAGRPGIDGHGHLPRPRLAPSFWLGVDCWSYEWRLLPWILLVGIGVWWNQRLPMVESRWMIWKYKIRDILTINWHQMYRCCTWMQVSTIQGWQLPLNLKKKTPTHFDWKFIHLQCCIMTVWFHIRNEWENTHNSYYPLTTRELPTDASKNSANEKIGCWVLITQHQTRRTCVFNNDPWICFGLVG